MINKIIYDGKEKHVYLVKPNGKRMLLKNDLSSKPIISPNKRLAAFISPFCWECMSNVYVVDLYNGKISNVYNWEYSKTPKYIKWYSNESLLLIIGETYGTVSIGGDLYSLNIKSKKLEVVKKFPEYIQITSFKLNENIIEVYGIRYIDNIYNEHILYKDSFKY
ncbi:DUF4652 domain-containing protein [Anaerosalibacter bizertensis]|uniref:DUF4652 domain-containing protein n=1 Tax=Anaerosalibacter bizertensis TaxID=932217 RepID=A0A844FJR1_9FIRM|nr:DUF4652 domain-containing protein [Anaerosalibacter bizertensis]MSS44180.1 DUF4652 domain-containing protein [Anaerosalibacter bizertensis]